MSYDPAPLSKTAKYKKITKPLLERKRRARINRCLDELKDLMVGALEIDDDNLSKLEKADILELTVNHLTKLHSPKDPVVEAKKFQAGFGQCAVEACKFIMAVPELDEKVSQNLVSHLSRLVTAQPLTIQVPERPHFSPPHSPSSVASDRQHYYSDHDRSSSDAEDSVYSGTSRDNWNNNSRPQQVAIQQKPAPMTGLLTTVDKLAPNYAAREQVEYSPPRTQRNNAQYFNRVPAEAKDAILKKIRQHIMDKRGNDISSEEGSLGDENGEQRYVHKEQMYRNELPYPYSALNIPSNSDTLDLRKVRSPARYSPEKPTALVVKKESIAPPEIRVESVSIAPEQCELPMDYSNLPPKKKRKMLEYQEHKKQEEAKRQMEAFYAMKNEHSGEGPPAEHYLDGSKWRPW